MNEFMVKNAKIIVLLLVLLIATVIYTSRTPESVPSENPYPTPYPTERPSTGFLYGEQTYQVINTRIQVYNNSQFVNTTTEPAVGILKQVWINATGANASMNIYNRNGSLMFTRVCATACVNGTFINSTNVPGVYYYGPMIISIRNASTGNGGDYPNNTYVEVEMVFSRGN